MPATTSITLLPTTTFGTSAGNYDGSSAAFNGDKVKGDGYYGFSDGVHTTQTRVTALVGTVKIQGTLVKDPANTDWVDIDNIVIGDACRYLLLLRCCTFVSLPFVATLYNICGGVCIVTNDTLS